MHILSGKGNGPHLSPNSRMSLLCCKQKQPGSTCPPKSINKGSMIPSCWAAFHRTLPGCHPRAACHSVRQHDARHATDHSSFQIEAGARHLHSWVLTPPWKQSTDMQRCHLPLKHPHFHSSVPRGCSQGSKRQSCHTAEGAGGRCSCYRSRFLCSHLRWHDMFFPFPPSPAACPALRRPHCPAAPGWREKAGPTSRQEAQTLQRQAPSVGTRTVLRHMRDLQAQPYLHKNQAVGESDSLHGQQQELLLLAMQQPCQPRWCCSEHKADCLGPRLKA